MNEREATERTYPYESNPGGTHWEGCWRSPRHHNCAVAEVYRLQDELAQATAAALHLAMQR